MLKIRRLIALLCILVLLGACAWVFGLFLAPYEAEAELVVRPKSDLELLLVECPSNAAIDDQSDFVRYMSQMISSRTVISTALRHESLKSHPVIRAQADPEDFVARSLEIEVKQPGLIVVRMSDRDHPSFCADMVNAIVDAFVSGVQEQERQQKLAALATLDRHLAQSTDLCKKRTAELENLRSSLMDPDREPWARMEGAKVRVEQLKRAADRIYEKLLEARLTAAEVGSDWDQEVRLERSKRYEEEYTRCMKELEMGLGQLAVQQQLHNRGSSGSFELDMRQHDIEVLRGQIDDLVRLRGRAELLLESGARVEGLSPAVKPLSRRHWFRWGGDAQ